MTTNESAPEPTAGKRGITVPAHHVVGMDLGFTCTNCGGHTSITAPCIPAKTYPGFPPATPDADAASTDREPWDLPCATCGLMPEHPDDREPIQPGDYHLIDTTSPARCPSCGLIPSQGSEGAERVAAARQAAAPGADDASTEEDVAAIVQLLDDHAGCVANGRLGSPGSGDTGVDVWSCGLEVPFVDNLDTMERLHLARALEPLVAAARGEAPR